MADYEDHRTRLARFKILEAHDAMSEAMEFLRRFGEGATTVEELKDFVMAYMPTSAEKEAILQELIVVQRNGGRVSSPEALELRLRMMIPQRFEGMDNLTALAATRLPKQQERYESYHIYHPDILVANLGDGRERSFGYICGTPSSGKTNVGCVLMEEWLRKGHATISNIKMLGSTPKNHTYANRMSVVLRQAATLRREDRPFLFIDDEAGLTYKRDEASTRRNKKQDKIARILGKLDGNEIVIEQEVEGVPRTIVNFTENAYYCPAPKMVRVDLRGPRVRFQRELKDIPRTKLPYDPHDIAWLDIDVDVDDLFAYVTGTEGDSTEQAHRIIKYLDGHRELSETVKVILVREMASAVRKDGKPAFSQTEIAKRVGVSQPTVSRWLRE